MTPVPVLNSGWCSENVWASWVHTGQGLEQEVSEEKNGIGGFNILMDSIIYDFSYKRQYLLNSEAQYVQVKPVS